ncbi:hypothetical protein A3731_24650 [Roseovarius sp. HI0049]|nr:hypothetical protein A3731_24650 [Roseovarius sp. HI0049]
MREIAKNQRETVRVRQRDFRGQRLLDVRTFYPGPDGEMRPSGKGISVSIDRAADLARAIEQVAQQGDVDDD